MNDGPKDRPYDVAIVGAGVVGSAIAWRLSSFDLRVLWLEACHDVAEGTSKANSAITASGYDTEPGTLEAELVRASSPRWERISADLGVPFRRIGSLVLAFTPKEVRELSELLEQAKAKDVEAEIIDPETIQRLAPAASPQARAALHVPEEGIIDPLRLTVGYAEVAVRNGVDLRLQTPVNGFRHDEVSRLTHVVTPRGSFGVRFLVNAAGLFADRVSRLAGAEEFRIWPRKGEFLLVDREVGSRVTKILVPIPTPRTRGILAIPTTNGTLLLGPTAQDEEDKLDRGTREETLRQVLDRGTRLVPGIRREHVVKAFAGLRPASERTYRVERSAEVPNLVHAAAIRSTGVSSSPAVAERVADLLYDAGLQLRPRVGAVTRLPHMPRLAEVSAEDAAELAARDPGYRLVVCACEHVTAAEIRAALEGPVPATTIDGIRKRTRAGGGRCQGAYCLAGIGFMLSNALSVPPWEIRQSEPGTTWGLAEADG